MGVALIHLQKFDKALTTAENVLKINPGHTNAWFNSACAYALMSDKENALRSLAKAVELDVNLKEDFKTDEDFKTYWQDEDFLERVNR